MTDDQLQQLLVLDSAPGPATRISGAQVDAIVDAVLAGAGFDPSGGGDGGGGVDTGGAAGTGASAGIATGTKLAILAGVALLVIAVVLFVSFRRGAPEQLAAAPIDAGIDAPIDASGLAVADEEVTIDPLPAAPPAAEPAAAEPPSRAKPPRREPEASEAADLLGEANAKRAAKQWRESDVLYARVVKRAPKSLAAQTALIASASLRLEHLGDPKGAATRFRRALAMAPAGALAEEARWGLAEAARAMHDPAGEAAALDAFLAHHATSPLAPRARARRAELP